ncbi:MAG: TlpA disulfide reductase family protein [Chloroflexota bacterium]
MRPLRFLLPVMVLVVSGCTFSQAIQSFRSAAQTTPPATVVAEAVTPTETPLPEATLAATAAATLDPDAPDITEQLEDIPNFFITTFDGVRFTLGEQRGKIVVLNFWASWCVPCRVEMPAFTKIWEQYKDRGVVFVGVAFNDIPDYSRAFAIKYNVKYPIGSDANGAIGNAYQVVGLPTTLLITRDGKSQFRFVGTTSAADLRKYLDKMLAQ